MPHIVKTFPCFSVPSGLTPSPTKDRQWHSWDSSTDSKEAHVQLLAAVVCILIESLTVERALYVLPVSICSVWYELAYIESYQGMQRSSKVWQLAFGSGFKFNSNVMVAHRTGQQHKDASLSHGAIELFSTNSCAPQ